MEQQASQGLSNSMDKPLPVVFFLLMPVYIIGILGVFPFPIAGDWRWLEAWLFVTSLTISLMIGMLIINQRNPRVPRKRMKMRKHGLYTPLMTYLKRSTIPFEKFFFCKILIRKASLPNFP